MAAGSHNTYRPDIDGLRALAVTWVVLYHAFPGLLPGGFIGVDVFFVISGFLITGIILREQDAGDFTISHFYSKRVRRIFPALLTVLVFCLAVGWLALTFDEYKQLSKHTGASALFINNFILWRESGYFDNPAETKPLLHMWSLAIEEQFYLFWPILLLVFKRYLRSITTPTVVLIALSFAYALWLVQVNPAAAFYSPLSRFWELLVGGLLAWWVFRHGSVVAKNQSILSIVGLCLLIAGLVLIDKTRAFPGAWALLPVLGTAALLMTSGSTFNRKVLSNPVMVWIGLISYPLYLWHWPLLVFARIFEGETPSESVRLSLVVTSVALAWLTYRLIEKPLRFSPRKRLVVVGLSLGMLCVFLFSYCILANKGLGFRHHNKLNADPQTLVIGADRGTHSQNCGLNKNDHPIMIWCLHDNKQATPNMAVLGDSKGEALYYGLSRESDPSQSWIMIGPVNYLYDPTKGIEAASLSRVLDDKNIQTVVLGNALRGYTKLNSKTGFIDPPVSQKMVETWVQHYSTLVQTLRDSGKRVVFVMDHPTLPDPNDCIEGPMTSFSVLDQVFYRKPNPRCKLLYSDHLAGTDAYQRFVEGLRKVQPDLMVFDPAPLLCDVAANRCGVTENNAFLYSYGDHISDYSSSKLAKSLINKLNSTPN
ncbi:acyltransferase family protein [Limnobacter sp.]|uniref:acyltransferase family protein n=1 Tax=Limnobacter sp. TaxID=2003368 RepID=UPI0039BC2224